MLTDLEMTHCFRLTFLTIDDLLISYSQTYIVSRLVVLMELTWTWIMWRIIHEDFGEDYLGE